MVADLAAVREFAAQWAGKGYEKGECQKFWTLLLRSLRFLDIFFFDWFLLCRSTFFPHFYPEVKALLGPQLFGFNKKRSPHPCHRYTCGLCCLGGLMCVGSIRELKS